jgi:Protein of unknown function (DUF3311)
MPYPVPAMTSGPRRPTPLTRALVYALFVVVAGVSLWVPVYNRAEPALAGIPFFYWFQVTWILVAALATALAYRLRL